MKIKKINFTNNKLLKISIIKTQLYKKLNTHFLNLNDIIFRLKQALQIIYKYHINNKKILFVGFPNKINLKFNTIIQNTKHVLIPNSFWINSLITNPKKCVKNLLPKHKLMNKEILRNLFLLKSKVDLVVILNSSMTQKIINESYRSKLPVIYLNNNLNIFDSRPTYKIPGNNTFSMKNSRNNFFYSIIFSLLKKAEQNKQLKLDPEVTKQFLIETFPNKPPILDDKQLGYKSQNYHNYKKHAYNSHKKNNNSKTFI
jgi:ribosomal protein S2